MKKTLCGLLFLMIATLLIGCGKDNSNQKKTFASFKWFDAYLGDTLENREISLSEFPGTVFHSYFRKTRFEYELINDYPIQVVYTEKNDEELFLFEGCPVKSIYFCDLNGDGKPEICSTVSDLDSEIIYDYCIIYDYANNEKVIFRDNNAYYRLSLKDNSLIINQYSLRTGKLMKSGGFICTDGNYHIDWSADESLFDADTIDKNFLNRLSFTNYTEDVQLYKNTLNYEIIQNNNHNFTTSHTPIYRFDNTEELESFMDTFQSILNFNERYKDIPSFRSIAENYDKAFFEKKSVLVAYIPISSNLIQYTVESVYINGPTFYMFIKQLNQPDEKDDVMSGRFAFVEINKEAIRDCSLFDARILKKYQIYYQ